MKFTYAPNARPVDGYTIRRGLHRGGFGEVYYAVSDAGKEVALKLLTHDLDTELRGIRQCLNLKHPNLVTIFDVKTDSEGDTWVIMEYVSGASLEDVLAAFPTGLPRDEVRDWMSGILAGVDYLHGRGIVHRDLKPANIYRENGVVKIGDVGLSKQMGGTRRQHTEAVGTVYYMAPEVAKGQYGPEVDVYSLGVMLYELLTGKLPFDGETTAEILMKHLSSRPDLAALPISLRPVLARALEKDPARRIRSAREFQAELSRVWAPQPLPESAFEPETTGRANGHAQGTGADPRRADQQTAHHQGAGYQTVGHESAKEQTAKKQSAEAGRQDWCDSFRNWRGQQKRTGAGDRVGQIFGLVDDVISRSRTYVRESMDEALEKDRRRREKQQRKLREAEEKAARKAERRQRRAESPGYHWWMVLLILAVLFVPWSRLNWLEVVGIAVFWGAVVIAVRELTRPATGEQGWFRLSTPSSLPRSERIAWSWLLSAVSAAVVTLAGVGAVYAAGWRSPSVTFAGSVLELHVWLILSVWLAATVVVTAFDLFRGSQWSTQPADEESTWPLRSTMLLLGLAVGAAVFLLGDFLQLTMSFGGPVRPMFRQIGSHQLIDGGRPTLPAFMICFAIIFWVQNWDWCLNYERRQRLRLKPVFWSLLGALAASLVSGLPMLYTVLWSTAITTTAQIAAPWQPVVTRRVPVTTTAA